MKIHVYCVCWNEAAMVGFFLRHYRAFAERIVVFDEDSTDGTASILRSAPNVITKQFVRTDAGSFESSKKALFDSCWKESKGIADWVMIVDMDEHVFHPQLVAKLAEYKRAGVTFAPALGFQMIADDFPGEGERLCDTRTRGSPSIWYCKPVIFDPNVLDEIDLAIGGHSAMPLGNVVLPGQDELMLLHYKFLGVDYVAARNRDLQGRRGPLDVANGWSNHVEWGPEKIRYYMQEFITEFIDISAPGFSPSNAHGMPWWRGPDFLTAGHHETRRSDRAAT